MPSTCGSVAGRALPLLPPGGVRLFPQERLHADVVLGHEVWCGMEVTYNHSVVAFGGPVMFTAGLLASAIGNSARKRQAERVAMEQWRPCGISHTLLTNHRMLAFAGNRWLTWDHGMLLEMWPLPRERSLVLLYQGQDPIRMSGPWAPWLCVVLAHVVFGPAYLAEHPEFGAMGSPIDGLRDRGLPPPVDEPARERGV